MSVIDVTSLRLGVSLGDGLRVTALFVHADFIALGTDSGCVLIFAASPGAAAAPCVYACALHCGAVHCLCLSPAGLFASAGRDAVATVQPAAHFFSRGSFFADNDRDRDRALRRLRGHTLPIAAMAFFADGVSLATCGIRGRLIVFDAAARAALCDVRVGFPARCLALSPDESVCFVGGAGLARVDLFARARPADPLAARRADVVRYRWTRTRREEGEEKEKESEREREVEEKEEKEDGEEECVYRIDVSCDGKITAHMLRGGAVKTRATWTHTAADFWLSRDYGAVDDEREKEEAEEPGSEVGAHGASGIRAIALCAGGDAPIVQRAPDGRDEWCTARVRTFAAPPIFSTTESDTEARSDAERVEVLQAECDALVRRIREELASRAEKDGGRKRPRASAAAVE